MLYFKALRARERRTIYAPAHHQSILSSIYEQLALPVAFSVGSEPAGRGLFHTAVTRSDGTAIVDVEAVGAQTPELVRQAVEDLHETCRLGAIYAALPLEDPGTPALCGAMESYGFFFSGVGPWMLGGGDALRLQMTLTPIDLSALVVVGDFGKVLLEYITSERDRTAGICRTSL